MATILDINAETRSLCDADSNSYPAADLLRRINTAYEEVVGFIIGLDGLWQFDDSNYTDLPIGTATLVEGQNDYSFNSAQLEIEKVAVKYTDGKYYFLSPIDKSEESDPLETLYPTNGLPEKYDKQGSSLFLYPAPDNGASVTLVAGLKVYFKRTASVYTSAEVTTGTKKPGFASPYHMILAYKAALPYCMSYKKDRVPLILAEIQRLEKGIKEHYGGRERDRRKIMSMSGVNSR